MHVCKTDFGLGPWALSTSAVNVLHLSRLTVPRRTACHFLYLRLSYYLHDHLLRSLRYAHSCTPLNTVRTSHSLLSVFASGTPESATGRRVHSDLHSCQAPTKRFLHISPPTQLPVCASIRGYRPVLGFSDILQSPVRSYHHYQSFGSGFTSALVPTINNNKARTLTHNITHVLTARGT